MGALFGMVVGIAMHSILGINNPESLASMRLMQVNTQLGMFILPPLAYVWLFESQPRASLGLVVKPQGMMLALGIVLMLVALPLVHWLAEWNKNITLPASLGAVEQHLRTLEEKAEELTKTFLSVSTVQGLFFNMVMIALIPAIGEELLFRAVIQRKLLQSLGNNHLAVFIGALAFSVLHFQFYGLIPRFMLGLFLGYFYLWSGSLWVPAVMHFVNNGLAVIAYYLHFNSLSSVPMEDIGSVTKWWHLALSLAITVGILLYVCQKGQSMSDTPTD
jgi:membrane protease YdiL (CAAX protease family)